MTTYSYDNVDQRVEQLLARFSGGSICTVSLLCDDYDVDQMAYRLIGEDLSATDYSYGQLREASEKFAGALKALGVGKGDRVATLMGKSWSYLVTVMGIWRLGAVHVPLFTAFAPPAIALRVTGSNTKVIVCDAAQQSKLAPGDDIPADAPWRVITTGDAQGDDLSFINSWLLLSL